MASHARGERPVLPARFCLFCCFRAPRIRMVCLPRTNLAASGHGMKLRQDCGSCGKRQDGAPVLRRIPFAEGSCEAQPAAESAEDSCGRVEGKTMTGTKEDDQMQWEFIFVSKFIPLSITWIHPLPASCRMCVTDPP
jgi:hypothetical protein